MDLDELKLVKCRFCVNGDLIMVDGDDDSDELNGISIESSGMMGEELVW